MITIYKLLQIRSIFKTNTIRTVANAPLKPIRDHHEIKMLPEKEEVAYKGYFSKILQDAIHVGELGKRPPASQRLERVLKYITPCGKMVRQHILLYTFKKIEDHYKTFRPENMEKAYKLGWCLEMQNSSLTIVDDVVDNHEMRRGKKTYWQLEGIGLSALIDSYVIQYSMYQLLKLYFSYHPNYTKILEIFMTQEALVAMSLEFETNKLDHFTMERFSEIAEHRNAHYFLKQPLDLATCLADKGLFASKLAEKVLLHLGWLYSFQNDLADCYDSEKTGTDIQESRCSGLIAVTLQKASPAQKEILEKCYGKYDDEKVARVKEVYSELDIIGEYYNLEKKLYSRIATDIKEIPDDFTRSLMENYAYIVTNGEVGVPPKWDNSDA